MHSHENIAESKTVHYVLSVFVASGADYTERKEFASVSDMLPMDTENDKKACDVFSSRFKDSKYRHAMIVKSEIVVYKGNRILRTLAFDP